MSEELQFIGSDHPGIVEILKSLDEITGIEQVRDILVVSTKYTVYFLKFNEDVDLWQVIHGLTRYRMAQHY